MFGGIKLLNNFSVTTQMAAVIEVVTNNETTRCREIDINGRRFILRKSRCEINTNNYAAYTILQLFNDFTEQDELDDSSRRRLFEYIRRLVEYIRVMKDNSIIIVLKGGIQIREPIETNN